MALSFARRRGAVRGVARRSATGLLRRWVEHESLRLARAWHLSQPLWLGFGIAQLLHAFVQRRLERAGVFGAALVGAWLALVMGSP